MGVRGTARVSVSIEFYTHDPEHLALPNGGVGIFLIDASLSPSATTAIASRFRLEVEESSDGPSALQQVRAGTSLRRLQHAGFNRLVTLKEIRR